MDKELALAIQFSKAPKELQDAATAHYKNLKAIEKLKSNLTQTNLDLEAAEKAAGETGKSFRKVFNDWTPEA